MQQEFCRSGETALGSDLRSAKTECCRLVFCACHTWVQVRAKLAASLATRAQQAQAQVVVAARCPHLATQPVSLLLTLHRLRCHQM